MKRSKGLLVLMIAMCIVSFMCLTLGITYSYVLQTKTSEEINMNTTSLNLNVTYDTFDTTFYPYTDDVGLKQSDFGNIVITNDSNYYTYYSIDIDYDFDKFSSKFFENADSTLSSKLISPDDIRYAVFKYKANGTLEQLTKPLSISSTAIDTYDTPSYTFACNFGYKFKLYEGVIAPGKTEKYVIKLWIDYTIEDNTEFGDNFDDTELYLKLTVNSEAYRSKLNNSVSGTLKYDNTIVQGNVYNIITGQSVETDENGYFELSNLYENEMYPLIITYNDNAYLTLIKFAYSETTQITKIGGITISDPSCITNAAYTYSITIDMFKKANIDLSPMFEYWPSNVQLPNDRFVDTKFYISESFIFSSNTNHNFSNLVFNIATDGNVSIS